MGLVNLVLDVYTRKRTKEFCREQNKFYREFLPPSRSKEKIKSSLKYKKQALICGKYIPYIFEAAGLLGSVITSNPFPFVVALGYSESLRWKTYYKDEEKEIKEKNKRKHTIESWKKSPFQKAYADSIDFYIRNKKNEKKL